MAISLDGAALDGSGYAGSRQRLPTTEGSQATSGTPCRSGSTSNEKLNPRRPCSSSQRRVTSASAATASQCSTKSGTSPTTFRKTVTQLGIRLNEGLNQLTLRGWSRSPRPAAARSVLCALGTSLRGLYNVGQEQNEIGHPLVGADMGCC